jgi:uncharacterized protein (DUF2267 family)
VVTYDDFIATVEREGDLRQEQAERAARATLETLSEHISGGEARDIAAQLPDELGSLLTGDGDPEGFGAEEFMHRIQRREHAPILEVQRHARAVFAALRGAISHEELADLASELPGDIQRMLVEDPALEEAEGFVERVARRAALTPDAARQATEAVLEVLAMRISGGEVDDLAKRLPAELHAPLGRGRAQKGEPAQLMTLKQFLMAVEERTGGTRAEARLATRAVFATLREAAGEEEVEDVLSQLPHEYRSLD